MELFPTDKRIEFSNLTQPKAQAFKLNAKNLAVDGRLFISFVHISLIILNRCFHFISSNGKKDFRTWNRNKFYKCNCILLFSFK